MRLVHAMHRNGPLHQVYFIDYFRRLPNESVTPIIMPWGHLGLPLSMLYLTQMIGLTPMKPNVSLQLHTRHNLLL
jgi:hypothetical protein